MAKIVKPRSLLFARRHQAQTIPIIQLFWSEFQNPLDFIPSESVGGPHVKLSRLPSFLFSARRVRAQAQAPPREQAASSEPASAFPQCSSSKLPLNLSQAPSAAVRLPSLPGPLVWPQSCLSRFPDIRRDTSAPRTERQGFQSVDAPASFPAP